MRKIILANAAVALVLGCYCVARSADEGAKPDDVAAPTEKAPTTDNAKAATEKAAHRSEPPPGMRQLLPDTDLWLDAKNKRIVMDGVVCLREGQLEMFACTKGTKEHESVVSVATKAFAVHAGLVAVGAKPGTPVKFEPEYQPASGTTVDITAIWTDSKGKVHHDKAQNWVQNVKTKKAMTQNWVFCGSGFWQDNDGNRRYLADAGDFICVSNFPSAMLDLPVESSQGDHALMFRAFTENIPPRGTKVRLVLTPRLEKPSETPAK
jgi:hypothetical protein